MPGCAATQLEPLLAAALLKVACSPTPALPCCRGPPGRGPYREEQREREFPGEYPARRGGPPPPAPAGPHGPPEAYGVRPPPPPPPRRAQASAEGAAAAAPGGLERTSSLQSNTSSAQQSDSTLASSRHATMGSSMPRSEPGSLADAVEQQQRQLDGAPSAPLEQPPALPGAAPPPPQPPQPQQPTRILKREQPPAGVPTANGVGPRAAGGAAHPPVNLPSQASLMDHLSSPSQRPAALGVPPAAAQAAQQAGSPLAAAARTMLPHGPIAPGMPVPGGVPVHHHALPPPPQHAQQQPVSVIAQFGGPGVQQQAPAAGVSASVHPGLVGHPQLGALHQHQHHQQQQQHAGAQVPGLPASAPLMTFGPPQQAAPAVPYAGVPHPQPSLQYAAPPQHMAPGQQQLLQFGAIQLPTTIDGSVDAEAPAALVAGLPAGMPPPAPMPAAGGDVMSAEAQHAYMKQKAEERARRLQEQQQQQQQQQQQRPPVSRRLLLRWHHLHAWAACGPGQAGVPACLLPLPARHASPGERLLTALFLAWLACRAHAGRSPHPGGY